MENIYINRDISWLAFNERALQEIKDTRATLYERIKFLAIHSNNLDEFYQVRIAGIKSLLNLKKKDVENLDFDPNKTLKIIQQKVSKQIEERDKTFYNVIIPELRTYGVYLIDEKNLNKKQKEYLSEFFDVNVLPHLQPMLLVSHRIQPFLQNDQLYLAVKLAYKSQGKKKRKLHNYAIVKIPTNYEPRFIQLPVENGKHYIIFLDDVVRTFLHKIFPGFDIISSYSFKITRDAELYIEDEFQGNLLQKILKSLNKREIGAPCRFTYDAAMPSSFLKFLVKFIGMSKQDLFPGGKYHNFSDFFSFPNPTKRALTLDKLIPNKIKELEGDVNLFDAIKRRDFLFNFPYHSYDHVLNLLKQASEDPDVVTIKITQYRVAKKSEVIKYLLRAAKNGKEVVVFVELKARFDEEQNITFAQQMEKAGINVLYSFPGLKVHSKILQITRKEKGGVKYYSYLGTGNFNESTARIYSDIGLFTADKRITEEVEKVFQVLAGKKINYKFRHLLVAQFNMRKDFIKLIDNEIANAKKGKEARMIIKMNSLEDKKMIDKLYEASQAGVKIDMIIRGICCLVPGIKGLSENIKGISIVDLYLEHARLFVFHNGGKEKYYASSADWMRRNLSRRIEVAFPIYDKNLQKIIRDILNIQLSDNVKARIIDKNLSNKYKSTKAEKPIQAQIADEA